MINSLQGTKTTHFAATADLFSSNVEVRRWRFEVIYSFSLGIHSTSSLNFEINARPENGSCAIDPTTGTVFTPFTVSCPGWFDEDEIKDYSLLSLFRHLPLTSLSLSLPRRLGNGTL